MEYHVSNNLLMTRFTADDRNVGVTSILMASAGADTRIKQIKDEVRQLDLYHGYEMSYT